MNRHKRAAVLRVSTALELGLLMSACTVDVYVSQPISGSAVDARNSSLGVGNATVTLECTNDSTLSPITTMTDANGNWSTTAKVPAGVYRVTVMKSGYFFPPVTFTLATNLAAVPPIPGFRLSDADAAARALSFILMWDKSFISPTDLDLAVTYPTSDMSNTSHDTSANNVFTSPYASDAYYWSNGFGPATVKGSPWNRTITGDSINSNYTVGPYDYVTHVTSSSNGGPETITFAGFPFSAATPSAFPIDESASNGLAVFGKDPDANPYTFAWMGVAELYVDAPNPSKPISSATSTTNAVVYAIQTNYDSSNIPAATYLGSFRVPTGTLVQATRVIRINLLFEHSSADKTYLAWQVVPDLQTVPEGGGTNGANFRTTVADDHIIGVHGRRIGGSR